MQLPFGICIGVSIPKLRLRIGARRPILDRKESRGPGSFFPWLRLDAEGAMRLVSISDLHGSSDMLVRILANCGRADAIVLAGDITHFGTPEEAVEAAAICRQTGAVVLTVAGNCDDEAIEARLANEGCSLYPVRGGLWTAWGSSGRPRPRSTTGTRGR